jgi:hypothetical protein
VFTQTDHTFRILDIKDKKILFELPGLLYPHSILVFDSDIWIPGTTYNLFKVNGNWKSEIIPKLNGIDGTFYLLPSSSKYDKKVIKCILLSHLIPHLPKDLVGEVNSFFGLT